MYIEPSEPSGWSLMTSGISCLAIYYAMTRPRRSSIISNDELTREASATTDNIADELSPEEQLLVSVDELRSIAEEHLSQPSISPISAKRKVSPVKAES